MYGGPGAEKEGQSKGRRETLYQASSRYANSKRDPSLLAAGRFGMTELLQNLLRGEHFDRDAVAAVIGIVMDVAESDGYEPFLRFSQFQIHIHVLGQP